ncbi:MAG: DUF4184 family protein, partial [Melioribacteraceae bacterium]|nr:DUF4184 family protein [Melioribacteraceae bacterium]
MPYTFSHIAFALPLKKISPKKISTTGLVIGSMLPDVEYYLRMTMYGEWGHTLKGIIMYEIAIGIVIAFIYHLFIRNPLIKHLPDTIKRKWYDLLDFNWSLY